MVSHHEAGLTLIEVLIALAIIAIALTAIIKSASQSIRSTAYLQDKTAALWVASEIINEARLGVITLSSDKQSDNNDNTVRMLNKDWHWQGDQTPSANPHIQKIQVNVFKSSPDEQSDESSIISLESYVYAAS